MKIAYVQTLEETALREPIEADAYHAELRLAAHDLDCPDLAEFAASLPAGDLKATGFLPGNVALWNRLSPGARPDLIILEIRQRDSLSSPAFRRYEAFCANNNIALEVITAKWRSGDETLYIRKAKVEAALMNLFQRHMIDLVLLDRFMFFIAIANAAGSPLAGRIYNSHPAPIVGELAVKGSTPMADTVALYEKGVIAETKSTVHEVTPEVDNGNVIATSTIPLNGVMNADHLRARFYAGYEAATQIRALEKLQSLGAAHWSAYEPFDPSEAASLYEGIRRPEQAPPTSLARKDAMA